MLQSIHIQNFRCFEDFKAEGFERINLIGGKNNSGKSCLLEGIFAAIDANNFINVSLLRNEQDINLVNRYSDDLNIDFELQISSEHFVNSYVLLGDTFQQTEFPSFMNKIEAKIITSRKVLPNTDTSKLEITEFAKLKEDIVKVLQIIDRRIIDLKIFFNAVDISYQIQFEGDFLNESMPINSMGDAIKTILRYFTPILEKIARKNKELSVLFIDEIENGIHYTAHKEFWQHLFKLCKELNVQVFATTHSLEMIKAFNEVALKEGEASYFEMMRDEANNNIEILKHPPKILEEELELKAPKFRGEEYKKSINLATDLMVTLNQASAAAKEKLKANGFSVPYIEDGWIWQLMPNGEKIKLEEVKEVEH